MRFSGSLCLLCAALAACLSRQSLSSRLRVSPPKSYKQTLHNHQNVQYYADFKIGDQEISGIFDTGSFELVVRSTRCDHCVHPTPPFDHAKSKSYQKNGTVTQHVYGSGPCRSMLGYDTVSVGGVFSAPNQAFWEIMDHRIQVLDTAKFAAIVGIGPNFAFGNKEKTLLMSYGVEEFSVCLQKSSGSVGFLTWGPTVSAETKHRDWAKAHVIGKHHWGAKLENVFFAQAPGAKNTLPAPCGPGGKCVAIIDSGTSLIAAPSAALMALSEQIPQIKEDCSNIDELPNLHFVIDGYPFELPPQAYVMRVTGASLAADNVWDILFFKPKIRKLDMCMPAFMQMDMNSAEGSVWILGMPFFRYFYTNFDRAEKAMYFAPAGPDCTPRPYHTTGGNRTADESLLMVDRSGDRSPMDIDINAIVPPTLSEMIDTSVAAGHMEI